MAQAIWKRRELIPLARFVYCLPEGKQLVPQVEVVLRVTPPGPGILVGSPTSFLENEPRSILNTPT